MEWCRGWELGAPASGDFTAAARVGRLADGRYVIAGIVREQFETNQWDALILTTANNDGQINIGNVLMTTRSTLRRVG